MQSSSVYSCWGFFHSTKSLAIHPHCTTSTVLFIYRPPLLPRRHPSEADSLEEGHCLAFSPVPRTVPGMWARICWVGVNGVYPHPESRLPEGRDGASVPGDGSRLSHGCAGPPCAPQKHASELCKVVRTDDSSSSTSSPCRGRRLSLASAEFAGKEWSLACPVMVTLGT